MLELQAVVLKPGTEPIDHVFQPGRISVVLGRNHSGKTALTRVLTGLAAPVSGRLLLAGEPLNGVPPGDRPVALVYQAFVNYPNWTVFENIASPLVAARGGRYGRALRGDPDAAGEIRERVTDIAERLGLETLLDRYPGALSGGQQQRLAIGRALAKSASVLVLDEPLVNLDYKLREALQAELAGLLHQLDISVIYTTSDPRDAFALADEVLLLENHGLLQAGPPLAVYERPVSPAAADLMSDPRANRWREAGGLALVRPEHLSTTPVAETDVAFEVSVLGSETNGSETFLHCALLPAASTSGGEPHPHWVARLPGLEPLAAGSTLTLYASAEAVLRFGGPDALSADGVEHG